MIVAERTPLLAHWPDAEPDMAAERLSRRSHSALILLGALLLGLLGLSALLQIGGAVIGSGEVTVESSVKRLMHPSGGVLTALYTHDGDHVSAGQPLLKLDQSVSSVGAASALSSRDQMLARQARLEAERDGNTRLIFPAALTGSATPEAIDAMRHERRFFELRRGERMGAIALLNQRIAQSRQQIESYHAQIAAIQDQIVLIGPELEGLRKLHEKQLVTINQLNVMERTAVQLRGNKAALEAQIAQANAQINETREQILNLDKQTRSDAANQLAELMVQLNDQDVRVASTADAVRWGVVRAPQSGTVDKIAFTAIGSAVPAGQPMLEIVPDRDNLVVEARIRPQDVDQVRRGQSARITFASFNRQTTPDIPGRVLFVSPDLQSDQRTGQSFYRIRVQIDADALARAPQIALRAGMPAEVFVQTGNRSILSFLIKPFADQLRYAMRSDG